MNVYNRMKRIFTYIVLIAMPVIGMAQRQVLSFGLRGGTENMFAKTQQDASSRFGYQAALDINHDFIFHPEKRVAWGLRLGLAAGYTGNIFSGNFNQQFVNTDYLGNEMDYTTSGSFSNKVDGCFLELPVLATMRTHGYYLGIGAKMQTYVYNYFSQTITNPLIEANFPKYGPTVTNEMVTGKLPREKSGTIDRDNFLRANLSLGLETGYEWFLTEKKTYIALSVYAYYSVWNSFYNDDDQYLVYVSPIRDESYPVPEVRVSYALTTLATKVTPLEFGLKLSFGHIFGD